MGVMAGFSAPSVRCCYCYALMILSFWHALKLMHPSACYPGCVGRP